MRTGRPSKYRKEFIKIAEKISQLGGIEEDIADAIGVTVCTLRKWGYKYPELKAAIKINKQAYDEAIEASLARRARGYSHPHDEIKVIDGEVVVVPTIKYYPPDTMACMYWLNNRQPDKWRKNKQNENPPLAEPIEFVCEDPDDSTAT